MLSIRYWVLAALFALPMVLNGLARGIERESWIVMIGGYVALTILLRLIWLALFGREQIFWKKKEKTKPESGKDYWG